MTLRTLARPRLPDGRLWPYAGFGCSSVWAKSAFPEARAFEILDVGYAQGLRMLDTGPSYGAGLGEYRLGRWLEARRPASVVLSTKVGSNLVDGAKVVRSFAVPDLQRSFADSLNRLGRERVDVLYLHGPSPRDLSDDVFRFFDDEKQRGRIQWSGVNSFDPAVLKHCVPLPLDVIMLQYNVFDQSARDLIPALKAQGKTVLSGTAFARAIYIAGTFWPLNRFKLWYLLRALKDDPWFFRKAGRLRTAARARGLEPIEHALRFVVDNTGVDGILFGTSSVAHMRQNLLLIEDALTLRGYPDRPFAKSNRVSRGGAG